MYLENTAGFLVDESRNTLDSTTASKTPDGWLGNTLDVVTKDLPVTLGATLSKTFASLASARHVGSRLKVEVAREGIEH